MFHRHNVREVVRKNDEYNNNRMESIDETRIYFLRSENVGSDEGVWMTSDAMIFSSK